MATRGQLSINGEPVKLFREIDRIKLGEVENAYLEFRKYDKLFERDNKKIKNFLSPPKPEESPEERQQQRRMYYASEYDRLKEDGKVLGTDLFFNLIKKNGEDKVSLSFIEKVLKKYRHKSLIGRRMVENEVLSFFIDEFVSAHIKREKLSELSKPEWINYWENIYEKYNDKHI